MLAAFRPTGALKSIAAIAAIAVSSPAIADSADTRIEDFEQPVFSDAFDGDYVIVAAGVGYLPDYDGSDDYSLGYGAAVRGEWSGIGFKTSGIGLELDVAPDLPGNVSISFGPEIRYRGGRSSVKDDVVDLLPDLASTVELGVGGGVSFKKLLTPMDSLSFGLGSRWDVSGKGAGQSAHASVSYFTALSAGSGAGISFGTTWIDNDYADYYFGITPGGSAATGGQLPVYDAKSGLKDWDATLYYGIDLDGDFLNGGWGLAAALKYERLLNSAAETPLTSMRGDRDQYGVLLGLGYTF